MKWSMATALFAAPLVLAGALQADLVERKLEKEIRGGSKDEYNSGYGGGSTIVIEEIVLVWVCDGEGSTTTTYNSASTGSAPAATHSVTVGGSAGLVYTPSSLSASVGDMVIFNFLSQNHTLTQAAFTTPCERLDGGWDSGFKPNPNGTVNPPPQMAFQVKVSTPLWFYCRQKGHCGKGMVFSINPTADKTQEMFEQMAIAQNGTGSTAGIVASSAPAAATTIAAVAAGTTQAPYASSPSEGSPPAATSGLVTGSGYTSSGDSCSCSCFCGVSSFPVAAQGINSYGGMSGAVPMAM